MNEQELLEEIRKIGAMITDGHFVYSSGRHGSVYLEKQKIYQFPWIMSLLCRRIAEYYADFEVDSVIAPAGGGTTISQSVAYHLWEISGRKVVSLFANRVEENLFVAKEHTKIEIVELPSIPSDPHPIFAELYPGDRINRTTNWFDKRRGDEKYIRGKRLLVVDDNLTTGASLKKVMRVARINGGKIVGLGVLWNRGGITSFDVGNLPLFAPINLVLDDWDENECPLCKAGFPISTEAGHGKEYLLKNSRIES